ncbi:PRC-barrel domain containing protein [Falsigemmobacter faecalis]|uniref:PRC-barrel domain containing protein n=1 Tax=Falsigemmobacter faecalis TaxID=2488730 RepID=A0A3P3DQF3_9RHOB|nr:PRC-barrel domain containing protein [Falsigemmobacter faecalis]RRH76445.1 PRC-barrel domain containing protein [Falsigemmobacter faecalis]
MHVTQHTPLQAADLTAGNLNGATIFGPSQERVGHVCALQGGGTQARVLVDLRDSRRPVSLPLSELSFSRDAGQALRADARWTRAELQSWTVPDS